MKLKYLNAYSLDMILRSQFSLEQDYKFYNGKSDHPIIYQSLGALEDYVEGKVLVSVNDLPELEKLSDALLSVSGGRLRRRVKLLQKIIAERSKNLQAEQQKYADINYLKSVLENKKQAQEMNIENFLLARETLLSDQSLPDKQKERMLQQLHSRAVNKYAEVINLYDKNFIPYAKFVEAFALRNVKVKPIMHTPQAKQETRAPKTKAKKENKLKSLWNGAKEKLSAIRNKATIGIKKLWNRYEGYIAVGTFALLGIGTWKLAKSDILQPDFEQWVAKMPQTKTKPAQKSIDFETARQALNQSLSEKEVAKKQNTQNKQSQAQELRTQINGDYYDTALQIHLGSKEAVKNLYNKIDSLTQAGKIKLVEGVSTKRYAHAFTMYNLIRPNSAENKAIQNLLSGGTENPELINRLVLQAKAKGDGVKPDNNSVQTSNFDKAEKTLQMQHLKNLQMQR